MAMLSPDTIEPAAMPPGGRLVAPKGTTGIGAKAYWPLTADFSSVGAAVGATIGSMAALPLANAASASESFQPTDLGSAMWSLVTRSKNAPVAARTGGLSSCDFVRSSLSSRPPLCNVNIQMYFHGEYGSE